ncbi:phosphatidylserine decarboxylase [Candidatus Woesearchaeota archaeon]|nr:phosphatidylserine decarboxylase [Candidatus Woesearchaeota archaeon]
MGWIITSFITVILLVVFFLLNFYRDPERKVPKGSSIVAPADGRIISIIDTSKNSRMRVSSLAHNSLKIRKGLFGKIKSLSREISKECYVISIFMSPFDVHINRAPIQGIVTSVKYKKGTFFKAYSLEKSLENEKNEIVIENKKLKVKVIQIAGFLARRIKCYVKKNQNLNKGQKIGMIALSSQTTMIIPRGVDLKVKINQHVKAGETIMAIVKNHQS